MGYVTVLVPGGFVEGEQVIVANVADTEERDRLAAFLQVTADALRCAETDFLILRNAKYHMGIANAQQPYLVLRRSAVLGLMATDLAVT